MGDSNCSIDSLFLDLLEFSEDRHPWESVEEKLNAIRYELLVVYFDHSSVHPSFRPVSLRPYPCPSVLSTLLSSPLHALPPTLFSFTSLLAPVVIPACLLPLPVPQSLSLSIPLNLSPPLRSCLAPFLPPYPTRSPLSSLNKLTNGISLAHRILVWFDFGFSFA